MSAHAHQLDDPREPVDPDGSDPGPVELHLSLIHI